MIKYFAIGYFKRDKARNTTSIVKECSSKIKMVVVCKENGFVPHLILSDEQMLELAKMDEVDLVETIVSLIRYTQHLWDVVDYLYQHCNSSKENI